MPNMETKEESDNKQNECKENSSYKRNQRQLLEMINSCVELYLNDVLPRLPQTYLKLFEMILSKALAVLALHGVNISFEQEQNMQQQNRNNYVADQRQKSNEEWLRENQEILCNEARRIEILREKLSEQSKILVSQVIDLLKQCEQFSEAIYFSEKISVAVSCISNQQLNNGQQEKVQEKQYSSSEQSSPRQKMSDQSFVGYDIVYFESVLGQFVQEAIEALKFIVNQQGPYLFQTKHANIMQLLTMLTLLKSNNFLASSDLHELKELSAQNLDYLQQIIAETDK